jgi:hypothetical protein
MTRIRHAACQGQFDGHNQTFTVKQTWATIPVYFRIDSDNRGFYAGGGLSLDILLDSKIEHEAVSLNNKDFFDKVDGVYQFLADGLRLVAGFLF